MSLWKRRSSAHEDETARPAAEGDGHALFRLAESHWRRGRKWRAIRYYRRSAKTGNVEAASALGRRLSASHARAREAWLQRAARMAVEQRLPATEVARHLRNAGQFDRFESVLRQAAESGDAKAAFELGRAFTRLGVDPAEAERYFRVAADSGHYDAGLALARLLMASGRPQEGGQYLFRAAALESSGSRTATLELGRHEWRSGHFARADFYLGRAAAADAPKSNTRVYAEFLCERGRAAEAAELLRTNYATGVGTSELREVANLLRRHGRVDDAAHFRALADRSAQMDIDSFDGDFD